MVRMSNIDENWLEGLHNDLFIFCIKIKDFICTKREEKGKGKDDFKSNPAEYD